MAEGSLKHSFPNLHFFFFPFFFPFLFFPKSGEQLYAGTSIPFFCQAKDQSTVAQWPEMTVIKYFMMSFVWTHFPDGFLHYAWVKIEHQTHDQKVSSLNPGRSGSRIFSSRVNFVCWLLLGVCSTPVLLQWHVKKLSHSAKSAGVRLHICTHTPLTQLSQSELTMPLSRHSVGTYHETSSHASCERTLDHSRLSLLSHCGLILV